MDAKADDDQDAFLAAFLQQRVADQRLGIERSLDDYCRRHPAHAAAIRAVWQDLHRAEPPPGTGSGDELPLATIGHALSVMKRRNVIPLPPLSGQEEALP